mmetsp:Transcript_41645/g.97447  ORF Transcript_41645/g.97447 Transcript_41645/m.97447 type:complete len:451 (-) Transcript_41645:157-1509(-)
MSLLTDLSLHSRSIACALCSSLRSPAFAGRPTPSRTTSPTRLLEAAPARASRTCASRTRTSQTSPTQTASPAVPVAERTSAVDVHDPREADGEEPISAESIALRHFSLSTALMRTFVTDFIDCMSTRHSSKEIKGRKTWRWPWWPALIVLCGYFCFDAAWFFAALVSLVCLTRVWCGKRRACACAPGGLCTGASARFPSIFILIIERCHLAAARAFDWVMTSVWHERMTRQEALQLARLRSADAARAQHATCTEAAQRATQARRRKRQGRNEMEAAEGRRRWEAKQSQRLEAERVAPEEEEAAELTERRHAEAAEERNVMAEGLVLGPVQVKAEAAAVEKVAEVAELEATAATVEQLVNERRRLLQLLNEQQMVREQEQMAREQRAKEKLERDLCVICLDKPKTYMIVPCGHKCLCEACAESLERRRDQGGERACPLCRASMQRTFKVFE